MGSYGDWYTLPVGRLSVPQPVPTESFDLLLHFHGGGAAARVVAPENLGLVLATVDAGTGSKAYAEAFHGEALDELIATVESALAPARIRHLIVSSWSAGYGAVRELLLEYPTVPRALVMLDSIHASYGGDGSTPQAAGVRPFLSYAERAASGSATMVITHSDIQPPGYASTSEVAQAILDGVGGRRSYAGLIPQAGVEAKTRFEREGLFVRGYSGTGKEAHCAHLRLLAAILRDDVLPRLAK
jgi:hypothetical protein